jgi:hypothetical protein
VLIIGAARRAGRPPRRPQGQPRQPNTKPIDYSNPGEIMRSNRAPVTNPDHYVAAVVFLILAASVAALIFGTVIGQGLS